MAVDLPKRIIANRRQNHRKEPVSPNPQRKLLHELYTFLARRTDSQFNKVVAYRMCHSKRNMPPVSVPKIASHMRGKEDNIAVVVGPVVDDIRFEGTPKLTVCALKFSETARKRIEKAGGECLTFDQLAIRAPKGDGCEIVRGDPKARKAERYFGRAAGLPGSTTKPRANAKKSR